MAWIFLEDQQDSHCLPESEGSILLLESTSEQLRIVKSNHINKLSYCEKCNQVSLIGRQSGTMLKPCGGGALPKINLIFGGFPCQDVSAANKNAKGLDGERSGLFFEIARLASELRPEFIFMENSPMLTVRGLDRICAELSSLGYDCRFSTFSAAEFGADHIRKRIYLLAHSNRIGLETLESNETDAWPKSEDSPGMVLSKIRSQDVSEYFREADGLPIPVGAIRSYGNAVIPVVAKNAFERLMGLS